jgi:hypothetical protein
MKYISLSIISILFLSGCSSAVVEEPELVSPLTQVESAAPEEPAESVDAEKPSESGTLEEPAESADPEKDVSNTQEVNLETLFSNLDNSCTKATSEGVVESETTEGMIRLVMLPEAKAYEGYSAFIQTPDSEDLIFESGFFLSCYLAGVNSLYEEQGKETPIKATPMSDGVFFVEDNDSLNDVLVGSFSYRFEDGLLVEVFEEDAYSVNIDYGATTASDEAKIKELVLALDSAN